MQIPITQKKGRMSILLSEHIDFRRKKITRDR